ncbi:hypothetical protein Tco_1155834 [Tanacetum coccineum]
MLRVGGKLGPIEDGCVELNKVHMDDMPPDNDDKSCSKEKLKVCCFVPGWRTHPIGRKGGILRCVKSCEEKKITEKKEIFGVRYHPNPSAVFFRSPEIAPSDRHDFRTVAS